MLQPKRVKHRKQHRGRMRGLAKGGTEVHFGDYGLLALDPGWVTNRQIEAARVAMTRHIRRGGKVWVYHGDELGAQEKEIERARARAVAESERGPAASTGALITDPRELEGGPAVPAVPPADLREQPKPGQRPGPGGRRPSGRPGGRPRTGGGR